MRACSTIRLDGCPPISWPLTLAAYAIPVSLAYATLAGLPPQVRVYGYLMGGLGYALSGSSRYLAVDPTSAISLMIAGTVGDIAGDYGTRYAEIATATAIDVFCLIAWPLRLSVPIKPISDSVLTGFKAGAGLTIAITQLPALLGVSGGGHNVPERRYILAGQLGATNLLTLALGLGALALLWFGERWLPRRPVALAVVALSIIASTIMLLRAIEAMYPGKRLIHVFLDNARYHHAKLVQQWLARSGCRIRVHFIPSYCPHLDPIERLWGLMHRHTTHNKCYAGVKDFSRAGS